MKPKLSPIGLAIKIALLLAVPTTAWSAACLQDSAGNYIGTCDMGLNIFDGTQNITIGSVTETGIIDRTGGFDFNIGTYDSSTVIINPDSSLTVLSTPSSINYTTVGKWRNGSLIIDNSQLNISQLIIADNGPGSRDAVNVPIPSGYESLKATLTASGPKALITVDGDLTMGNWNAPQTNGTTEGILTLNNKAKLTFSNENTYNLVTVSAGSSNSDRYGNTTATINIDDATFNSMGRKLIIAKGNKSFGYVNISNNGIMTVSSADIGNTVDSAGYVNVLNGGQFVVGSTNVPGEINLAKDIGSIGIISIGAKDDGDSTNSASGQVVGNITFGQGDAQLVFNHNNSDYIFSNLLSGGTDTDTQVIQQGVGTTTLTNTENNYVGNNIIRGGTLKITDDRVLGNESNEITFDSINDLTGTLQISDQVTSDRNINMNANGTFKVDQNKTYTLNGNISGVGEVTVAGGGTMLLKGTNTYTNQTNIINNSTLIAGVENTLSANSTYIVGSGSSLQLNGTNQIIQGLDNSGVVSLPGTLGDSAPFSTLTISNNYVGRNGLLIINTQLDDDNSLTDFIDIKGQASGSTQVEVNNIGGKGAQTEKGIHIIQTDESSANTFILDDDNYLTAGAYTYSLILKKGEKDALDENITYDNWYLTNNYHSDGLVYTPDIGSYLANEMMGNTLFTSRLEDREGASQYQNLGNNNNGNVWIRTYGGHNQFKSMSDQLKTKGDSFVTQIGTGLVTLGEEDQYNLGAMAGYAHYSSKTKSNLVDLSSKSKMNGYSVGLYGTWYAFPLEKRGAYIDSWVLWNSFKNTIDTADQHHYKYDSSGVTASVELGGNYLLNQSSQRNWWIQPQSQIIYQGVHMDDFYDEQDYKISHGSANVQARMGFKTYLEIPSSEGAFTNYRPYVAMNFIHNTNPYAVDISGEQFETQGSQNLGEFKLGIEGNLGKDSYVWANASYVAGSHSNQAYQGNIGWKYNF